MHSPACQAAGLHTAREAGIRQLERSAQGLLWGCNTWHRNDRLTIPYKSLPDWELQSQCGGASLQGTLLTYSTGNSVNVRLHMVWQQPTEQARAVCSHSRRASSLGSHKPGKTHTAEGLQRARHGLQSTHQPCHVCISVPLSCLSRQMM